MVLRACGLCLLSLALGAACTSSAVDEGPCSVAGGQCVSSVTACAKLLPAACSGAICCIPGAPVDASSPVGTLDAATPNVLGVPESGSPPDAIVADALAEAETAVDASNDSVDNLPDAPADAGVDSSADGCTGYASPNDPAPCQACSGSGCQANGCFGGYFCNLATDGCISPSALPCDAGP